MIRMGRGNRTDQPSEAQDPSQEPAYRYAAETQTAASRGAISESDSMARDIKEGRLSGFVGHGTTLTGETEFQAMLRVDGHLVGTVSSEAGTLIVGTNGQLDANVSVAAAMINGNVNGDIRATEKLQLGRTARVMGNIYSPRLIVEEGAIIEGSCSMIKERETSDEEEAAASGYASPGEESAAPGLYDSAESADAELTEEIDDGDQDEESAGAARV